MAEDDKAEKHRVFFPRPERWKNETPQNRGPADPFAVFTKRGHVYAAAAAASIPIADYFKGKKIPESLKDIRVYKTPNGPVFTRPERPEEQARRERETQKKLPERQATAHVALQFKQQQADQIAEHRRQTSRLRAQHREQFDSLFAREADPKEDRIRREIKTLHDREKQAVKEFDAKRKSLAGRAAELVKGKEHFDTERAILIDNFQTDRRHLHDGLRAVPGNFLAVVSEQHRRHVRERLAMMQTHRQARLETQQQHERDRPRLVAERLQAVERNAQIERGHQAGADEGKGIGNQPVMIPGRTNINRNYGA
jgi:hypothetical protein